MDFGNFVTSQTGLIHFVASILALIFGTLVLYLPKGTLKHKRIGKLYAITMVVVLSTAFMTYTLFWDLGHLSLVCVGQQSDHDLWTDSHLAKKANAQLHHPSF